MKVNKSNITQVYKYTSIHVYRQHNNNNKFVERHSAVASEALAEQVS